MASRAGPDLTDQQRRAITARGVSVALSAGAGCGKTYVLTERFLAELDPEGPQAGPGEGASEGREHPRLGELIAITFTERAAREMRDRIRAACRRRLLEVPDGQVDYWLALIRELDSARISTIHSFCGALLRSHAVEAALDPQFRVLEQVQADTLLHELIDDELRNRLIEKDEAVIDLVVDFGLESLRGMVATLLGRRHQIDWAQWQGVTPEQLVSRCANGLRFVRSPPPQHRQADQRGSVRADPVFGRLAVGQQLHRRGFIPFVNGTQQVMGLPRQRVVQPIRHGLQLGTQRRQRDRHGLFNVVRRLETAGRYDGEGERDQEECSWHGRGEFRRN